MRKNPRQPEQSARRHNGDAKRHVILRGAKAVFLKCGFGGTSMDAVAARAGVSKMTVYRHFGDKEELFAGVITELCKQILDKNLKTMFEHTPVKALRHFGRTIMSIMFAPETVELHRIVIAESRRFPKLGRFFYKSGPQTSIAVLAAFLARNKANPSFRIRDPRRSAEEFLELLRGYAHLRALLGIGKAPSRREIDMRIDAAVRHIIKQAE